MAAPQPRETVMPKSDPLKSASPKTTRLILVSHDLCPYVQRAVVALTEKGVPFEHVHVDLAHKPDWFLALSPLGKVPLLQVDDAVIFESAVILEYLEETQPYPLHPSAPLVRARHRAMIELGSAVLADIWRLEVAPTRDAALAAIVALKEKFVRLERELGQGPWFGGDAFGLVDAAFGPVFRYFDLFDRILDHGVLADLPKVAAWRAALAARPSVRDAVVADYSARLARFIVEKDGFLAALLSKRAA
jgi:glutathione S-transferase